MNTLARALLRWSWAILFIWFGAQQLLHPGDWVGLLPEWTGYLPIPGEMFIQLNGWFEVCFAMALVIGCYTRFAAALLSFHLLGIAISVGSATGVRDAALSMAGFSLALGTPDDWTLDRRYYQRPM